ncbi:tetratricopeptide repeat-containing sensor histidine kinase [Aquimarina aggregata]|uniref:tetratricopeptide repeat-containing sensor histidine kinase n=1 Tax=Aquimarina aggregata TaxID=1642818 RepID=UPI002491F120|nr:sensor histidine kinase [Aquimarina aggregata]
MRKTKYFLSLIFVLSSTILQSQHFITIDSLITLQSKQKGIVLAKTLNELSWEYTNKNDSLAINYAQKARKIGDSLGYSLELATSYIRLGTIYLDTNKFETAEYYLLKALELEKKEKHLSGIARAKAQLGKLNKKLRNYDSAIQLYEESLLIRKQENKKSKVASLYNNIAQLYKDKNDPINALKYYHKSIDLRDSIQDKKGLIKSYKNIGAFYNDLKKYKRALIELEKGKKISIELQDSIQLSSILLNMGTSYNYLNKLDSALVYFNKGLVLKEKLGIKKLEVVYHNLGSIKEKKNDLDNAIFFYEKSIAIAKQNKNKIQLIDTYLNLGKTYKKKQQYNKALVYYDKALALAETHKKEHRILGIILGKAKVYEQLGDYQKAHLYNERSIILSNELEKQAKANEEIIQKFKDQQIRAQNRSKIIEIEKEKLEVENQKKTTQLISLIIVSILTAILFFILFRYYKQRKQNQIAIQNEKIKQVEIEELLKNQELKSIHAMIDGQEKERKRIAQDLHDRLGSMLAVVKIHYKAIEENLEQMKVESKVQYEKASILLDEACVAVREISHDMVSGVLTKFGLIPALNELKQNIESTGALEIELIDYGFDDRIHNELEITIYRIIQELIGNTLKHANAKEMSIQLLKKETTINITVIDDGNGFDTCNIKSFSGMGIKGIQSRVESLQGSIFFDSGKGNGTTITIDIPINHQIYTI